MNNIEKRRWEGSMALSVFIHIIIILLFFFALPSTFERLTDERDVLTFEIVPLSAISNIKTETTAQKDPKELTKARLIKNTRSNTQNTQNNKKDPPKKETIDKKLEQVPVKKIQPTKIKEDKKNSTKQQNTPTNPPKKDEDIIDSILNNLEKESQGDDEKARGKTTNETERGKKLARGKEYNNDRPLSITEESYFKKTMAKYWRNPEGLDLSSTRIILHITLGKGGEVKSVTVKDVICPIGSTSTCKLLEDSAMRAIWSASPFDQLQKDRYDIWQSIDLSFGPDDFE